MAEERAQVGRQPVGVAGGGRGHHDRAAGAERGQPGHHQGARGVGHGEDRGGSAEHGREAGLLAQQRGEVCQHHGSLPRYRRPVTPARDRAQAGSGRVLKRFMATSTPSVRISSTASAASTTHSRA